MSWLRNLSPGSGDSPALVPCVAPWASTRLRYTGSLSPVLLTLALICCNGKTATKPNLCRPCRPDFSVSAAATKALRKSLLKTAETQPKRAELQGLLADACLCFGKGESVVDSNGTLHLPIHWTTDEQAARALHLQLHRLVPPWPQPGPQSTDQPNGQSCAKRVAFAVQAEAEAHVLELEARRALQLPPRYSFEEEYRSTPQALRESFLVSQFASHTLDNHFDFESSYGRRCAAEVKPSGNSR